MQQNNKNEPVAPPSISRETSAPECDCSAGANARLYEHHRDCHWLQYVSRPEAAPLSGEACSVCSHAKHSGQCTKKLVTDGGTQCPCVMALSEEGGERFKQGYKEGLRDAPYYALAAQGQKDAPGDTVLTYLMLELKHALDMGGKLTLPIQIQMKKADEYLNGLVERVGGSPARSATELFDRLLEEGFFEDAETWTTAERADCIRILGEAILAAPARSVEAQLRLIAWRLNEYIGAQGIIGSPEECSKQSEAAWHALVETIEDGELAALPGSLPSPAPLQVVCNKCQRSIKWSFGYWRDDNAQALCIIDSGPHEPENRSTITFSQGDLSGNSGQVWPESTSVVAPAQGAASPAEGPTPDTDWRKWADGYLVKIRNAVFRSIPEDQQNAYASDDGLLKWLDKLASGPKPIPHCPKPDCGGSVVFNRVKHGVPFMSCTKCHAAFPCATAEDFIKFFTAGPKSGPRCPKCPDGDSEIDEKCWGNGDQNLVCKRLHVFPIRKATDFAAFFTPSAGEPQP